PCHERVTATRRSPRRRQTSYESRQGRTEQARVLLTWSYSAVVYLAIVVLTLLILRRRPDPCFSKPVLKCDLRQILARSLFFKAPHVWDDRRPRPRAKLRSPCRAVSYVHDRRLDAASDGRVTAVLPV